MKKQLITLIFLLCATMVGAQDFKSFKTGIGFGLAIPDGGAGLALYLEPSYRIIDEVAVGDHPGFKPTLKLISAGT